MYTYPLTDPAQRAMHILEGGCPECGETSEWVEAGGNSNFRELFIPDELPFTENDSVYAENWIMARCKNGHTSTVFNQGHELGGDWTA